MVRWGGRSGLCPLDTGQMRPRDAVARQHSGRPSSVADQENAAGKEAHVVVDVVGPPDGIDRPGFGFRDGDVGRMQHDRAGARDLIARAEAAREDLFRQVPAARDLAASSAGHLIFPSVTAGGFIFGGQYGNGVLFKGGQPAGFYNITGGSFGLQAGARTFRRPTSSPRHKRSRRSSRQRASNSAPGSISPSRTWARQVRSAPRPCKSQSSFSSTASGACSAA